MRQIIIRDPVHGDITVPPDLRKIIDTRTFQRLRYIQQLASCHYAFPAATHTRFSHSIGAFHLAQDLVSRLQRLYPGRISDEDARLVTYGALLHDVGHPPFSHMLESPEVFATFHSHEDWGRRLCEAEDCDLRPALLEQLGAAGLERLFDIMAGRVELPALHEIVSSQLDVDRLDYLLRDKLFTGVEIGGFDVERLFRSIRLTEDGHLAVGRDGLPIVEAYLVTRWHMYYLVYFHRVTVLTQVYYTRALLRARQLAQNGSLQLGSALHSILFDEALQPRDYLRLIDAPLTGELFSWESHPDPELSGWARRLSSRGNFHRRISGTGLGISAARRLLPQLREEIRAAGFSPERDLILSRARKRGYLPYQGGILTEHGQDVRELSKLVQALEGKIDEVMIFVPPSCVERCVQLLSQ